MVYSANVRKIIMLAFISIFFGLIVFRAVQRICLGETLLASHSVSREEQDQFALQGEAFEQDAFEQASSGSYNFAATLRVIELAQEVKAKGHSGIFLPRQKKINTDEIKMIIDELYRERTLLRNYVWELKGQAKVAIPPRRYRALMYSIEVLDRLLIELTELMPG